MCDEQQIRMFRSVDELDRPTWVVEIEWIEDDLIQQRFFEVYEKRRAEKVRDLLSSGVPYSQVRQLWYERIGPFANGESSVAKV